jgi:DNA invertase Pin-like site-specific DNA recombinase
MSKSTCPLPPGSLVWSYLRVSGDEQADRGVPIAGQRQKAQDYADANQLVITRWFIDEAKSGGSTVRRDQFNEMIDLSRTKPAPVHGILVWDLKRFARNLLDSQFHKADLRRRGYTLIFLSDDIPETDFAPVYETILEWKAEKDRADIAKDVQRGLQTIARLGYAPGGFPPKGYKAEVLMLDIEGRSRPVRRWVPDPDLWDTALQAWQMRAAGASFEQIHQATHLFNAQNALTDFFTNRTYLGSRLCGELVIEHAHEPMITQELWNEVQKRRARTGTSRRGQSWDDNHPRRATSSFLLSGLLFCEHCGSPMSGSTCAARARATDGYPRRPWRYYVCSSKTREGKNACPSGKIKAQAIEQAVIETLVRDVLTVNRLEAILKETNDALSGQHDELTKRQHQLQRDIASQENRIARLVDAVESEDSPAIRTRLRERELDRDKMRAELAAVVDRVHQSRIRISRAALGTLVEEMQSTLTAEDVPAMRELLRTFVVRITVSSYNATQGDMAPHRGTLYHSFRFPLAATGI